MSMRLDAMDEKFLSTRPAKRTTRKSDQRDVRVYLRTVRPVDDDRAADRALRARDGAT